MKAVVSEREIRIVPEDANEEYALRMWTKDERPHREGFVLEVQTKPGEPNHQHRFRFKGQK